jgi:predicted DNA-binding ribbon-helix-helix protein
MEIGLNATLYELRSRSIRIGGTVTSIRLENVFWEVLAAIADTKGITTSRLISDLCARATTTFGSVHNLASVLRVTCMLHYRSKTPIASGELTMARPGHLPAHAPANPKH